MSVNETPFTIGRRRGRAFNSTRRTEEFRARVIEQHRSTVASETIGDWERAYSRGFLVAVDRKEPDECKRCHEPIDEPSGRESVCNACVTADDWLLSSDD